VVSLLDVGPTVLDWAGLPVPKSFRGRSLVRQRPGGAFDLVVGEKIPTFGYDKGRSWFARRGPWKLILTERGAQLYDLEQDPGETRDVSAAHPLVRDVLAQAVMAQVGSAGGKERPTIRRNDDLAPAVRKELDAALRTLGYIQ
jgi:arylsulfatase A-like enzyme